jgi:molecular chaperone GrpE
VSGNPSASAGPAGPADGSTRSGDEQAGHKDKRKHNGTPKPDADSAADSGSGHGRSSRHRQGGAHRSADFEETPAGDEDLLPDPADVVEEIEVADVDDAPTPTAFGAELEALRKELEERTADLQRVTAEYANYRKRVDRDRALVVEQASANVLGALLPVLDDLDRARDHGDLVGPFGAVAEQLTGALTKFGLTVFGAKGDPFDPTRHEAVAHLTSAEVTEPTCIDVMRRGYLLGERLLRPALVAVADPE